MLMSQHQAGPTLLGSSLAATRTRLRITTGEINMAAEHDWSGPRHLRQATIISFIPAFPLCLAHGVVSRQLVPAMGLLPLAGSAILAVFLLRPSSKASKLAHPAAIFSVDAVLAAGLMVTLAFTWISVGDIAKASDSVLAAYATMPLLLNL
jgi:hypothetical protein